jgi:formate dehydrogenase subunit gamma
MSLFCPKSRAGSLAALVVLGLLFTWFPASAAEINPASPIMVPNPGADLWRAVRQRDAPAVGQTQVGGVETGVLIDSAGEDFRNFRRQDFIGNAAIFIGAFAALILVFYFTRGCIKIPGGRSGRLIKRFSDIDRTIHWFTAILFIFQALTGMVLLFGRFVLLPVFGQEAFGVIASACLEAHNLFGPLFLVALFLLFTRFVVKNIPKRRDLTWLMKGGGAIGEGHVSAGFFNAGEKIWFWAIIVLGLTVSITGLILDFPIFAQGRETMQLILIVHGITAVLLTGGSLAHIYIGTIGSEGSLDSMTTGYVDENWAEAHHDIWHAEMMARGEQAVDQKEEKQETPPMDATPDKA